MEMRFLSMPPAIGSDGQEYPGHVEYDSCPECGEPVDPANCWVETELNWAIAWHPECRSDLS